MDIFKSISDFGNEVAETVVGIDFDGDGDRGGIRSRVDKAAQAILGNDGKRAERIAAQRAKASYKDKKRARQAKYASDGMVAEQKGYLKDARGLMTFVTRQAGKLEAKMDLGLAAAQAAALPGKTSLEILQRADKYQSIIPSGQGMWEDAKRGSVFVAGSRIDVITLALTYVMLRASQAVVVPAGSGTASLTLANLADFTTNSGMKSIHATWDDVAPAEDEVLDAKDVAYTIVQTPNGTTFRMLPGLQKPLTINAAGQAPIADIAAFVPVTTTYTASADHKKCDASGLVATDLCVTYMVGKRGELRNNVDFDGLLGVIGTLIATGALGKGWGGLFAVFGTSLVDKFRGKNAALFTQVQALSAKE